MVFKSQMNDFFFQYGVFSLQYFVSSHIFNYVTPRVRHILSITGMKRQGKPPEPSCQRIDSGEIGGGESSKASRTFAGI